MSVEGRIWKRVLGQTIIVGGVALVAAFTGARIAIARNGVLGNARSFVTVAGTLTGIAGTSATITFEFQRREGATTSTLCAPAVMAQLGAEGAFSVPVPLDDAASPCPSDAFDGRDVWVRALVSGSEVAAWAPVNPVPYAHFANQYGTPDCPVGYRLVERVARRVVCSRGNDDVVRVGDGPSAFWIDRYEASVWTDNAGTTGSRGRPDVPWGAEGSDYPEGFPRNGQWALPPSGIAQPLYAVSRANVIPSSSITWFQAQQACRLSGKQLPTTEQWISAAQGTPDPGADPGTSSNCRTGPGSPRETGAAGRAGTAPCVSIWGAQDMIGNLREIAAEPHSAPGDAIGEQSPWPDSSFHGDTTINLIGQAANRAGGGETYVRGMPSVVQLGGAYGDNVTAGIFAMYLHAGLSSWAGNVGFRCVIPR